MCLVVVWGRPSHGGMLTLGTQHTLFTQMESETMEGSPPEQRQQLSANQHQVRDHISLPNALAFQGKNLTLSLPDIQPERGLAHKSA